MEHALHHYRLKNSLSLQAFAERARTSKATLSRIENWKSSPSGALLRRIVEATNGEVQPNDFFDTPPDRGGQ